MGKLIQRSFLNALGTGLYVVLVALLARNAQNIFGQKDSIIDPIAILMVFVLSAAVTGSLVLGKPVLMYANNQKTEAVKLFLYTIAWLVLLTIIVFIVAVIVK